MADYKQTTLSGTSYVRSNRVIVENPHQGIPSVHFVEETIVNLNGDIFARPSGAVSASMESNAEFDLLNPETGEVIGKADYHQVYVLLHSLYFALATQRDAADAVA